MNAQSNSTRVTKKSSISIQYNTFLKAEKGILFSEKDFIKLGDIYISIDVNLHNKCYLLFTLSINSPIVLPYESKVIIHDDSKIIASKTNIIEKVICFIPKYTHNNYFLDIKPDFIEKLKKDEQNKKSHVDFTIEIIADDVPKLKNINSDKQVKIIKPELSYTNIKANTINAKTNTINTNETKAITQEIKTHNSNNTNRQNKTNETTKTVNPNNSKKPIKTSDKNETKKDFKTLPAVKTSNTAKKVTVKRHNCPYNGIHNQGATCYINCSIQTLFFISYFRNVIYKIPSPKKGSMISELQYLFCNLQCKKIHCNTENLTKSLKISGSSVHVQQDIQEFLLSFIEKVQNALKNNRYLKDKVSYIFEGKIEHKIKNERGFVLTSNTENFKQLLISVSNSVESSLNNYFESEKIDDYTIGDKKDQIVTLESKIVKLPRILQIVIKRYKNGELTNTNVKDDSKVIFKEDLDLAPYYESYEAGCTHYKLFAVIAHSGTTTYGHYSVYLKPEMKNEWLFFSDTNVRKSTANEAIERNYGGTSFLKKKMIKKRLLIYHMVNLPTY